MPPYDRTGKYAQWDEARRAESHYNTRLRAVARQVDQIIRGLAPNGVVKNLSTLLRSLEGYAELIEPWAVSVAQYMLSDVRRRNERIWKANGMAMAKALRAETEQSEHGQVYRDLMQDQVQLIKIGRAHV